MKKENIFIIILLINGFFSGFYYSIKFDFLSLDYFIGLLTILITLLATRGIYEQ